jgi:S-adenosylmethionine synthetase
MGEITTSAYADVEQIARECIRKIGYTDGALGFDASSCSVMTVIHNQSPDIALGVDNSFERTRGIGDDYDSVGAGDQGIMFGYACDETPELMPLPIGLAHKVARRLAAVRRDGTLAYLRPDGKCQVTVEYEDARPVRVDTVVVSAQHSPDVDVERLRADIREHVVRAVVPAPLLDADTKYYINPTGKFVVGGPQGDSGLTGRKIITDTYGGHCPHGGGAFSGKDPTKVDRSASYMARYACKNLVAAGLCKRVQLQVSYAIALARPVSLYVDTFGTGILPDDRLADIVREVFDFRPKAIIDALSLRRPIYYNTANYGHFGNADFPWEKTDKIKILKNFAGR